MRYKLVMKRLVAALVADHRRRHIDCQHSEDDLRLAAAMAVLRRRERP